MTHALFIFSWFLREVLFWFPIPMSYFLPDGPIQGPTSHVAALFLASLGRDPFSHLPCVWGRWWFSGVFLRHCAACFSIRICLIFFFFHDETGVMDSWEEDHRHKEPLSSCLDEYTCYQPDLWLDVGPDCLAEVVCQIPPLSTLEGDHRVQPTPEWEVAFIWG